ncbi:MAG: hypothetical protein K0R26_575 [Bacteroidota bacterium]|jgi:hypothetical protein|nr:hypothetical protein [Bacteroidota bacterium]
MNALRILSSRILSFTVFLLLLAHLKATNVINPIVINTYHIKNFDDGKPQSIEEKLKKYAGTFQIQVKDPRLKPNIPYNIDELIEKNRKTNETVYIELGSQVRLKIFSSFEIKTNFGKEIDLISTF